MRLLNFDDLNPNDFDGAQFSTSDVLRLNDLIEFEGPSYTLDNISSFGEDSEGNLYLVDFDGEIFRFTPAAIPEPSGLTILAIGLLARSCRRRK